MRTCWHLGLTEFFVNTGEAQALWDAEEAATGASPRARTDLARLRKAGDILDFVRILDHWLGALKLSLDVTTMRLVGDVTVRAEAATRPTRPAL